MNVQEHTHRILRESFWLHRQEKFKKFKEEPEKSANVSAEAKPRGRMRREKKQAPMR